MLDQNQKNLFIIILAFIVILGFFFFYFQTKISRIESALTSLQSQAPSQEQQEQPEEQTPQPPAFNPPEVKTYTIAVFEDMLSPAGMTVSPKDKIEFKLKNNTEAEVIFKANSDLGIAEDISLQPNEEKSITFTSPANSGKYKFSIKTSQQDLEGLLIVR